jgi:hypothetical protein
MNEFTEALDIIADVMKHGAASHPDNDWVRPDSPGRPPPRPPKSTASTCRRESGPELSTNIVQHQGAL